MSKVAQPPVVGEMHNGFMKFVMFGRPAYYLGGPYVFRPSGMPGVKMAKEIREPFYWTVPTEDFKTPPYSAMAHAMVQSIAHALRGNAVYVGCMGGRGRTGLFLATLAYLTGSDDPVAKVREEYYPHAVETEEQADYVSHTFDRDWFRLMVMRALVEQRAVDWRWFMVMPWKDKLLYLRTRRNTLPTA